jgi:hypothetical protein
MRSSWLIGAFAQVVEREIDRQIREEDGAAHRAP